MDIFGQTGRRSVKYLLNIYLQRPYTVIFFDLDYACHFVDYRLSIAFAV